MAASAKARKPPPDAVGRVREAEFREAARVLGVREVNFLDYCDGDLDRLKVPTKPFKGLPGTSAA